MGKKTFINQENGDDTNTSLRAVNFDSIHNEISNFVLRHNRRPTLIVMHPSDGDKFIELLHKECGYLAIQNLMNYRGLKLIRSFDVEEGNWSVY